MKGIILAGGSGSRLGPLTSVISKQLLPVYDKPMIYYPLNTLMLAGVREILVISTPADTPRFSSLLGDGSRLGVSLSYRVQPSPDGIAQAFILAEDLLKGEGAALILGDNIFYGGGLEALMKEAVKNAEEERRATVFGCLVKDPERFGVVVPDAGGRIVDIVEKPAVPASNYAVPGLYFCPAGVSERAKELVPSARGELEISDLDRAYLRQGLLDVKLLPRDFYWQDAGTVEALAAAAGAVRAFGEKRGGLICVPEETAFMNGWISREELAAAAERYANSEYGAYLGKLAEEGRARAR